MFILPLQMGSGASQFYSNDCPQMGYRGRATYEFGEGKVKGSDSSDSDGDSTSLFSSKSDTTVEMKVPPDAPIPDMPTPFSVDTKHDRERTEATQGRRPSATIGTRLKEFFDRHVDRNIDKLVSQGVREKSVEDRIRAESGKQRSGKYVKKMPKDMSTLTPLFTSTPKKRVDVSTAVTKRTRQPSVEMKDDAVEANEASRICDSASSSNDSDEYHTAVGSDSPVVQVTPTHRRVEEKNVRQSEGEAMCFGQAATGYTENMCIPQSPVVSRKDCDDAEDEVSKTDGKRKAATGNRSMWDVLDPDLQKHLGLSFDKEEMAKDLQIENDAKLAEELAMQFDLDADNAQADVQKTNAPVPSTSSGITGQKRSLPMIFKTWSSTDSDTEVGAMVVKPAQKKRRKTKLSLRKN